MRIHALHCFIDKFKYTQVERLLTAIEGFLNGDKHNTYLVTNVNPLLTGVMLINTLQQIAEYYRMSEFRANSISEIL